MAQPEEQFDLVVPAHRFSQGGRCVYSFILDLPVLDQLLPDRVDERIAKAEDANRPLTLTHARTIQEYLEKQEKWLFGAMMLGIDPKAVEFQPLQDSTLPVVAGQLRIHTADEWLIFDGQHRRRAIRDALEALRGDLRRKARLSILDGESVPIMLYEEPSINSLRQMFADAAQTRPIESNAVARFDRRNAFNLAADQLLVISEFLGGRVEMERPSVARTSPNIIAVNQLASTLKVLDVGIKGRVSKERNDENLTKIDELVDRFWSGRMNSCPLHGKSTTTCLLERSTTLKYQGCVPALWRSTPLSSAFWLAATTSGLMTGRIGSLWLTLSATRLCNLGRPKVPFWWMRGRSCRGVEPLSDGRLKWLQQWNTSCITRGLLAVKRPRIRIFSGRMR